MSNQNSFTAIDLQRLNGADAIYLRVVVDTQTQPAEGIVNLPVDLVVQKQVGGNADNAWEDDEIRMIEKAVPINLVVQTEKAILPCTFEITLAGKYKASALATTAFRSLGTGRTRKSGDEPVANSTAVFKGSVTFHYLNLAPTVRTHKVVQLVMKTQEAADPGAKRRTEKPINEYVLTTVVKGRKSNEILQFEEQAEPQTEQEQAAD